MVRSIPSLSSCHSPLRFCSFTIQFFLRLWLAVAWKNFVFLSPHFSQNALDLWFHIISSLTWTLLICLLTFLIFSAFPCKLSYNSNCWSFSFFLFQHLVNITKLPPIPSLKEHVFIWSNWPLHITWLAGNPLRRSSSGITLGNFCMRYVR